MEFKIQVVNWQEHEDLAIEGNIKNGAGRVKVEVEKPDEDTVKELFKFLQPGELVSISKFEKHLSLNEVEHKYNQVDNSLNQIDNELDFYDEGDLEPAITEAEQAALDALSKEEKWHKSNEEPKPKEKSSPVIKDFDPSQIGDAVKSRIEKKNEEQGSEDQNLDVTKPDVDFRSEKFNASDFEKQKAQKEKPEKRVYEDDGDLGTDDEDVQSETEDEDRPKW